MLWVLMQHVLELGLVALKILSPPEYFWGYNRMLTVDGLFGAGDTVGGSAHKFSSGSFTEGRLAAKAAVKYIEDKKAEGIKVTINNVRS